MTFDENASQASPEPVNPDELAAGMSTGSGLVGSRRLLTSVAAVVAAVAVAVAVAVTPAAPAAVGNPALKQPQPTASSFDQKKEEALWHREDLLSNLNEWIDNQPGIKTSGYVTSIDNPDTGSIILVWYGPPDRIQRQIIDEARRRHIPIAVRQSRYSTDDVERAIKQLAAIDSGTDVFQNFKVSGVGTDINFDGVKVIGEYIHPPAEGIPAADTTLMQAMTAKTGVAATIEHGEIVPA